MDNFSSLAEEFRNRIKEWDGIYPLRELSCFKNLDYRLFRTVVYNSQLDRINPQEIKVILVGDNPGMEEQKQNAYLVGKSGRMADNFFTENYGYDFYRNVLIMNKTPLHTKSTSQLAGINRKYPGFIRETQEYMAGLIFSLAETLNVPVFVTGFAGCRTPDGKWLKTSAAGKPLSTQTAPWFFSELKRKFLQRKDLLFLFKHFSYGNFSRDLNPLLKEGMKVQDAVKKIGSEYAAELLADCGLPEQELTARYG